MEDEGVVGIIKREGFLEMGDGEKGDGKEAACRLVVPVPLFVRDGGLDGVDGPGEGHEAGRPKKRRRAGGKGVSFVDAPLPLKGGEAQARRPSIFGGGTTTAAGSAGSVAHEYQTGGTVVVEVPLRQAGSAGVGAADQ